MKPKPVVKKPTKKPKGKKMTRAKWQAAKQKALESKEKKEQKAAEKVVAKLQKSKLSGLASVLTKPQSSSDTDEDGRHGARGRRLRFVTVILRLMTIPSRRTLCSWR